MPLVQNSLPSEAKCVAQLIEAIWQHGVSSRADLRERLRPGQWSEQQLEKGLIHLRRLGVISESSSGSISASDPVSFVIGRVTQNPSGAWLIQGEEGIKAMLPDRQARRVLKGDRVLAHVRGAAASSGGRAKLVALLGTDSRPILGRFEKSRRGGQVIPLDRDQAPPLTISANDTLDARDGECVQVEVTEHPFFTDTPSGRVVARVDDPSSARWLIDEVIHRRGFETDWPVTITTDLRELSARAQKPPLDHGRLNLTDLPFVTIDGIHARDFDDAIFCARRGDGFSLDVAIADVAFWVREGSAIDRCAAQRGNSVYLPDRVLPMLPELLSNDLCSLRPNQTRFVFVCRMQIDAQGEIRSYEFVEATIRSAARLTYDEVNLRIQNPHEDSGAPEDPIQRNLLQLADITERLYARRIAAGGVDFSFPEVRYDYRPDGWLKSFWAVDRSLSTRVVEECMLIANICAAQALSKHFPQAMYRVHEPPDRDAVTELGQILGLFGIRFAHTGTPEAKHFAAALAEMREQPVPYDALQALVLRCMKQARYSSLQLPHFALGFEHYTHFTSPIRRYPDLVVHRLLKNALGLESQAAQEIAGLSLDELAAHCSQSERQAEEAEREITAKLKAEFMRRHIGESFSGTVSGVTAFGIFVALTELPVDGLVHISELADDYFDFDVRLMRLTGRRTAEQIKLGDEMQVTVAAVNVEEGKIDLVRVRPQDPQSVSFVRSSRRPRGKKLRQK